MPLFAAVWMACAAVVLSYTRAYAQAAPAAPANGAAAESDAVANGRKLVIRRGHGTKAQMAALIAGTRDPQDRAKLTAMLGRLPAKDVQAGDFDAPLADADAQVRLAAVAALGARPEAAAADRLEKLLASDPSAGVRMAAAFWLGAPGREAAASALGTALSQDKDSQVRLQAAQSLSRLGTSRAKSLLRAAANDSDERVRAWAR